MPVIRLLMISGADLLELNYRVRGHSGTNELTADPNLKRMFKK